MKILKYLDQHLISIVTFILMIGIMGTRPFISLLSNDLHATPWEIGIITGIFPLLPFLFAIKIGQYVDRLGYKKPIIFSSFLCSISLMIPMFIDHLIGIYISQIIAGITHTIFVVAAQTMVGELKTDGEIQRDKNIMKFSIGVALGSFIGPLIGGFIAGEWGYPKAFGILGGIGLISTVFSFFLPEKVVKFKQESKETHNVLSSLSLLKTSNIRKAFLISVLVLLGKDIYTAYFPLLALEFGLNDKMIGIIISLNAGAGIFIRWSIPYLIKNYSKSKIVISSIVLSGTCLIILPFFSHWVLLAFFSFLLGIGLGIGQPLSISATIHYLPKERVGEGLGLRLTANRLTQMAAPIIFGGVAEFTTMSGVFWIIGGILFFAGKKTEMKDIKRLA